MPLKTPRHSLLAQRSVHLYMSELLQMRLGSEWKGQQAFVCNTYMRHRRGGDQRPKKERKNLNVSPDGMCI